MQRIYTPMTGILLTLCSAAAGSGVEEANAELGSVEASLDGGANLPTRAAIFTSSPARSGYMRPARMALDPPQTPASTSTIIWATTTAASPGGAPARSRRAASGLRSASAGTWGSAGPHRPIQGPAAARPRPRAPYFHNGSAADLDAVVNFYNDRFQIGFTTQQHADLVAFLRSL